MKVKDLIKQLEWFDPEDEIVLKERDGRTTHLHQNIRAYAWDKKVQIDGWNPIRR